jgi:cbb3-type cytochrome oxidase maturation protein
MESLYILIPVAIIFVAIAIAIFLWAVKSDQFDDLERHGHNVLFDDDLPSKPPVDSPSKKEP